MSTVDFGDVGKTDAPTVLVWQEETRVRLATICFEMRLERAAARGAARLSIRHSRT
jgi:hypothetical protein